MDETICAIATAAGEGGIGIVRVSGEKAVEIAASVVQLHSGRSLQESRSRVMYAADIDFPANQSPHSNPRVGPSGKLDHALVVVMRAPRSYTGEDVVEIHSHGSPLILQMLCATLADRGARLAMPGEFTRRAFLNGKIDLLQAEGVLDTIQAKTAASLRIAQGQLRGGLSRTVGEVRAMLIHLLAQVEAGIDFAEEDISIIQDTQVSDSLHQAQDEVDRLLSTAREGRIFREGISVAIAGRPNVGKSSLLNALLETDRAIVTPVPGTTRDVLDEVLNIRGIPVRLFDTAGLRSTEDLVEREGIVRTREAIDQAELLLLLVDGSTPLIDEDRSLLAEYPTKPRIILVNKVDLPQAIALEELRSLAHVTADAVVRISAKTGEGLDELRDAIRGKVVRSDVEPAESALLTRTRHQTALAHARDAIEHAMNSVGEGMAAECVAMDVRAALEFLGELSGETTTEDILDRIFQDFCIGK